MCQKACVCVCFFAAQRLLGKFKKCSVCVTASQVKDPHLHNFSLYFFTFLVSFSSPGCNLIVSRGRIFRDYVTVECSKECVTLKHETWLCDQWSALMDKSLAYINTYLPPVPMGWRLNLRYVFAFFIVVFAGQILSASPPFWERMKVQQRRRKRVPLCRILAKIG